jgi:hypothetical protein
MIIEVIGRRLRLGIVGGGPGSVIGDVHRAGARLDGYYEIVAAALSSDLWMQGSISSATNRSRLTSHRP